MKVHLQLKHVIHGFAVVVSPLALADPCLAPSDAVVARYFRKHAFLEVVDSFSLVLSRGLQEFSNAVVLFCFVSSFCNTDSPKQTCKYVFSYTRLGTDRSQTMTNTASGKSPRYSAM